MTDPIRIGHIALSCHEASAWEVARILESHGHDVTFTSAPHEAAFAMLGRGEIDILASAWLPSSHEAYLAPMLHDVDKITVLYEPYCIWGGGGRIMCRKVPWQASRTCCGNRR
ncbi:glycine betaine ABC transporter substrate-binding protein [Cobetia marina]|uniref:glycine betaine ABC transporter substrate-binding protein n=1 Tax=Cobetia marina TaxID=28258 RepID=UPI00384DD075